MQLEKNQLSIAIKPEYFDWRGMAWSSDVGTAVTLESYRTQLPSPENMRIWEVKLRFSV
jgi:hypothetical protein